MWGLMVGGHPGAGPLWGALWLWCRPRCFTGRDGHSLKPPASLWVGGRFFVGLMVGGHPGAGPLWGALWLWCRPRCFTGRDGHSLKPPSSLRVGGRFFCGVMFGRGWARSGSTGPGPPRGTGRGRGFLPAGCGGPAVPPGRLGTPGYRRRTGRRTGGG